MRKKGLLLVLALLLSGCASLGGLAAAIQSPRFEVAPGQQAELRVLGPSLERPLGGAAVRIWTRVSNPNAFGFTLSRLDGTLFLEGQRSALVDLPLGLPLQAMQDTIIPLDIAISFSDLPALADLAGRALLTGAPVNYRLDGRVGVDAGMLGQPTFGPMELVQGQLQVRR